MMPSKYTLNASLTEHLSSFVAAQVASGRLATASEVVRAALRRVEQDLEEARSAHTVERSE
jgi:putative addiction module CopG family antidote